MQEAILSAYQKIKTQHRLDFDLKGEQFDIIQEICNKRDVFALLPTGFGKSLAYIATPLILDEIHPDKRHRVLVISPLKALMKDQVAYLKDHDIKAAAVIEEASVADIRNTDSSILFASPEAAVLTKWKNFFRDEFSKTTCALVFDEAHCISLWGLDFRPVYREVSEVQSLFNVPNLALTATATQQIQNDIYQVLGFQKGTTSVVAALPNRQNIFLEVRASSENYEEELKWILDHLSGDSNTSRKKILVYVRSINVCVRIYLWLFTTLMASQDKNTFHKHRVEMFHANTDSATKDAILEDIVRPDGTIQTLICTVAFGMGVNVANIDIVVHWGMPPTTLNYWQEVGRCARDGRQGYAVCYAYKRSLNRCTEEAAKIASSSECIRLSVLEKFQLSGMATEDIENVRKKKNCASGCKYPCPCSPVADLIFLPDPVLPVQ